MDIGKHQEETNPESRFAAYVSYLSTLVASKPHCVVRSAYSRDQRIRTGPVPYRPKLSFKFGPFQVPAVVWILSSSAVTSQLGHIQQYSVNPRSLLDASSSQLYAPPAHSRVSKRVGSVGRSPERSTRWCVFQLQAWLKREEFPVGRLQFVFELVHNQN